MATDRPVRFTFQLIQLSTPAPRTVLLLHDKHQHMLVCPKQVYNSCLGQYCTYPAFYKHLNKPLVLTEQDAELQQLIQLAGMSNTASKVSVVSLADCCKAMQKPSLRVPPQLLAAFLQLKDKPTEQTVMAPQHGSPTQMLRPFPVSLPTCQVPSSNFGQPYGLNTITQKTSADHIPSSPATVSALKLLHHNNQA